MKAISLWQPWASAIACEVKRVETRSWPYPSKLTGQRIAIHAAKRFTIDERNAFESRVAPRSPEHALFVKIGIVTPDDLPLGCIVATAVLSGWQFTRDMRAMGTELSWGNFAPGRYGWLLEDIEPLAEPVPCVGRQGFFDWDPTGFNVAADNRRSDFTPCPAKLPPSS